MEKEIKEIPFGAKDSELYKFEYAIPEGMEAIIDGNKVIIRKKESEDERIRRALIRMLSVVDGGYPFEKFGILKKDALSYLERQKERVPENVETGIRK